MATVTASHCVSRSSHGAYGGAIRSDRQVASANQIMTHSGLRSLNKVDMMQLRTNVNAFTRQFKKKAPTAENDKRQGVVKSVLKILLAGTEVGPWSKTGGLGDVLGGLAPALAAMEHRVMTISPRHDQYKDAWDTNVVVEIKVGDAIERVRYYHTFKRGVDRVFVDHPMFLEKVWGKTGAKIYGPVAGTDYEDNQLRFSLFCQAILEAALVLDLSNKKFSGPYGEDVIFIANDWHTALVPCYLKSMYQSRGIFMNAKVVFCIHNIAYQGRFAFNDFVRLNLPEEFKGSFDFFDGYAKPVKGRKINWLKAGVVESDRVVTVSPYYAEELTSGPDKGVELEKDIRKKGLKGILNGMDNQEWNPLTDKYIAVNYDASTVTEAKAILKEALQAEVGLPVDRNIPLIGFIGRLEEQKGSDILAAAIPGFIDEDVQVVILGTGKKEFEKQLEELATLYPSKARGIAKFNVPLAHKIIAGATFIVIPSRFEPCGLVQLQAMPYGSLCIVATTGGLHDTVEEGYTGFQIGPFSVECDAVDPEDVAKLVKTVKRALAVYDTPAYTEMVQNAMAQDFSWKGPAKNWERELLSLGVAGSKAGSDAVEVNALAKENVPTP